MTETVLISKIAIGLRKDNPAFKAWLDQWVKTNLANGTLNEIYKKNHGADLSPNILGSK